MLLEARKHGEPGNDSHCRSLLLRPRPVCSVSSGRPGSGLQGHCIALSSWMLAPPSSPCGDFFSSFSLAREIWQLPTPLPMRLCDALHLERPLQPVPRELLAAFQRGGFPDALLWKVTVLGKGTAEPQHKAVRTVLTPFKSSPLTVTSEKESIHSVIILLRGLASD